MSPRFFRVAIAAAFTCLAGCNALLDLDSRSSVRDAAAPDACVDCADADAAASPGEDEGDPDGGDSSDASFSDASDDQGSPDARASDASDDQGSPDARASDAEDAEDAPDAGASDASDAAASDARAPDAKDPPPCPEGFEGDTCETPTCHEDPRCDDDEVGAYCDDAGARYECVRDAAGCLFAEAPVACEVSSECRVPACRDGACTHESVARGLPCTGGICDGDGECVQCLADKDCSPEHICDLEARVCVAPRCGDGRVTSPEEECDPSASGMYDDTFQCSTECVRRKLYTACDGNVSESCLGNRNDVDCVPIPSDSPQCLPVAGLAVQEPPSQVCPTLQGDYVQKYFFGSYCVIECETVADCPPQLGGCIDNTYEGTHEAKAFCIP